MTGLMRGLRSDFPQVEFIVCSQIVVHGLRSGLVRRGLRGSEAPLCPGTAGGGNWKRVGFLVSARLSALILALEIVPASIVERAQGGRGITVGLREFANWKREGHASPAMSGFG